MATTTEQIKIGVKLETSGLEQGGKRVESTLNRISNASAGVSTSMGGTSASMEELYNAMDSIKHLEFA